MRTINVPTVPLDFTHPRHRGRLSFETRGEEVVDGVQGSVFLSSSRAHVLVHVAVGRCKHYGCPASAVPQG